MPAPRKKSKTSTSRVGARLRAKGQQARAGGSHHGYHHGDLKLALIEAALRALKTRGPEDLSLRELARAAGVSQAAPYRHFRNKLDLLAAISQQGFELKAKYMEQALAEAQGDPERSFYGCGQAYFRMGVEHPQHLRLMVASPVIPSPEHPELLAAAARTFVILKTMIHSCQTAGFLGPGDCDLRAMHCWSAVNGFTLLYAEGRLEWLGVTPENCRQALDGYLRQHLHGAKEPLFAAGAFEPFQTKASEAYRALIALNK